MAKNEIIRKVSGYDEIVAENAILEKYGFDYSTKKGEIRSIIDALHPQKLDLTVSEIAQETASAKSIKLVSEDGCHPPFQAGQYINVFVETDGIRTSRPYSIASSPAQTGYYEIMVRRVEDGFVSNYLLDELKPGDRLSSSSPSGNFHYNPLFHGDKLAFIAGGSGITPFMSMIRELADKNLSRRLHLFYGSRVEDDVIYRKEIDRISSVHRNFTWDSGLIRTSPFFQRTQGIYQCRANKRKTEGPWTGHSLSAGRRPCINSVYLSLKNCQYRQER